MTAQPSIPVFDVGAVLIDWNPRYLYRKLFDDEAAMETFLATVCTPAWNLEMDAGRPWDEGIAELVARFPDQAPLIRAFRDRWPEMVSGPLDDTVDILAALKAAGRPLYAITNFSAEKFAYERARRPFFAWFDGIVVSGEIGCIKPAPEIYHRLLDTHGLEAADCLFIDDTPANVEGARAVGMHVHHFIGAAGLREALEACGML